MISNPYQWLAATLFLLPGIAIAIPAHELGHALAAYWMGDRTVRNRGYLSPSEPRKFFTLYGLLMMLFWRVGWGERIPVNEYRQESLRQKLIYDFGGPAANLVLAIVFGLATRPLVLYVMPQTVVLPPLGYLATILYAAYFANLSIMAFNLLPIPGFDGWRILEALFRRSRPRFFMDVSTRQQQIQYFLLIGLFIAQFVPGLGGGILGLLLTPFYAPAATLILGGCSGYPYLVPCLPSGGL
ncbi:MAG TPA: site-2 protease family protein [Candidatus Dormibacteraeota bacterium]